MVQKRKIKIARHAGFCFGVRRAVAAAEKALKRKNAPVFCLGELIHNPQAVARLEKAGLRTEEKLENVPAGVFLIIRSHGVGPEIMKKAGEKKIKVIDATCPFVRKAQLAARDFLQKNYQVVICGDARHAEVIGLNANAENQAIVVKDAWAASRIGPFPKIGLLSQTTQKAEVLKEVALVLAGRAKELSTANTICSDSATKQKEVKKMAAEADVMVVIGGKNSSNTLKLVQLSRAAGAKTFHIETPEELEERWFKNARKIGLAAGASTPDDLIAAAKEKIDKFFKKDKIRP